jgi:hypothetical protein
MAKTGAVVSGAGRTTGRHQAARTNDRRAKSAGFETAPLFAGAPVWTLEHAARAGAAAGVAIAVVTNKTADAVRPAAAAAVHALALAGRVLAGAFHVARARSAGKFAGAAGLATAGSVRAGPGAIGAGPAVDVTRRTLASEATLAARAAMALAVAALSQARWVVTGAVDVTRRRNAR